MSQYFIYKDFGFEENVELEDTLNTPRAWDIGFFVEIDLKYPNDIKEKQKNPFLPNNQIRRKT